MVQRFLCRTMSPGKPYQKRASELRAVFTTLLVLCLAGFAARADAQIKEWTQLLKSEDPVERSSAATSLLTFDDEKALRVLLDYLKPDQPEDIRISVVTAFRIQHDDRATPQLIACLEDKSQKVQQAALKALKATTTPRTTGLMKQVAADGNRTAQIRVQVIGILGETGAIDAIGTLIDQLSDRNESVTKSARDALQWITLRSFETIKEWQEWWEPRRDWTREQILEELTKFLIERIRILAQQNERLRKTDLARLNPDGPGPIMGHLAETDSAEVKLLAINKLCQIKKLNDKQRKDVVVALAMTLDDGNALVRQAAARGLGDLGDPAAADALIARLKDAIVPVRVAAATSLGKIKTAKVVDPLCALLADPSEQVAVAAAHSLGGLADPKSLEALKKAATNHAKRPALYEAAAKALAKMKDPRVIPVLIGLLTSPNDNVRYAAVDALGRLRAKDAVNPVSIVALEDKNAQIREGALATLAKIGDLGALDAVLKAFSDKETRVAEQAFRCLDSLANGKVQVYATALDRLLSARQFALVKQVLKRAEAQLSSKPNHLNELADLRHRVARGFIAAQAPTEARPFLEELHAARPKEPAYIKDLIACLRGLKDDNALWKLLSEARRTVPDQRADWWAETVKVVEQIAAAGDAKRVIAVVGELEKEDPKLGTAETAKRLNELRQHAKERLAPPPPPPPKPEPKTPPENAPKPAPKPTPKPAPAAPPEPGKPE